MREVRVAEYMWLTDDTVLRSLGGAIMGNSAWVGVAASGSMLPLSKAWGFPRL